MTSFLISIIGGRWVHWVARGLASSLRASLLVARCAGWCQLSCGGRDCATMIRACWALAVAVVAPAAAAAAPGSLFGLTMIGNSPARGNMCSIDPATGNVTLVGGLLPALSGTDDCRAIDSKRGIYYYLGDTHQGTTLVGLSLQDGSVKCSNDVPLKEIGFVGIGQGLKYDEKRDRLILVGFVANSTGGVTHQVLIASLADSSKSSGDSCASFTKAGTFPLADNAPMLHSSAYDEASQTLYTTIIPAKGEYALAVVDLAKQQMVRVELEGTPPIDEMSGMSWDADTGRLIGIIQDGHNIQLLSLDPQGQGKWSNRQLIAPPEYALSAILAPTDPSGLNHVCGHPSCTASGTPSVEMKATCTLMTRLLALSMRC